MVIDNFNVTGIRYAPFKANSPAVIDTDRILPAPVAAQFFEPVARWGLKVNERVRGVEHGELTVCYRLNLSREFIGPFPLENLAGFLILERDNHTAIISRFTINGILDVERMGRICQVGTQLTVSYLSVPFSIIGSEDSLMYTRMTCLLLW
jgi:hypothetical protein